MRCCYSQMKSSLRCIMRCKQELRRGADPACIYSLAFSRAETPEWLAVSSDKGTVHVFKLTIGERSAVAMAAAATNGTAAGGMANPVSPLSFVSVRSVLLWLLQSFHRHCQALH